MEIMKKIAAKSANIKDNPPVTLAFLGDSVTQGCFECYIKKDGNIETVFDQENGYHAHLKRIIAGIYTNVPINIINAGISGGKAVQALERIERDVIRYSPDLCVVCFGLNDSTKGEEMLSTYLESLDTIFKKLKSAGIETIFMTPNMMCTDVNPYQLDDVLVETAIKCAGVQNDGMLEKFLEHAKKVALDNGAKVCDCYAKWKALYENGANVTDLLANKINHPTREMNKLFAVSLFETMLS